MKDGDVAAHDDDSGTSFRDRAPQQPERPSSESCDGERTDAVDVHADVTRDGWSDTWTDDSPPERLGPYRIIRVVGEGGMGIVYEAEQREPVRRTVALKLIKWGMSTERVIARFESERQALALMNHPSIASVYDGGATREGRPYFAMELVSGVPITDYCDEHRLSVEERIALVEQVCEGVQHAHQKGIIHRDLKPSNILVTVQDGRPLPKIIDFGIAKAVSQRLTERTLATELGQLVGTPEYMSPEQADVANLDIDTRTDVYSLGAVLYELLVGAPVFEAKELRGAGLAEMQKRLQEDDPQRPSTRVGGLGDLLAVSATNRRTDGDSLASQLKGDLDWITMKALEKDRARRYETANELALDLRRYREHDPVQASPQNTWYRLGKLVRRHRVVVASVSAVSVAVLIGLLAAITGFVRASRAEERAVAEAAKATAINDFMQRALGSANPQEGIGRQVTVLEALGRAVDEIDAGSFEAGPEVEAAVRSNIGLTYMRLGLFEESESLLKSAVKLQETLHGREHLDVAETLTRLAALHFEIGQFDRGEELGREALAIRQAILGEDDLLIAESLDNLGIQISYSRGDFADAESLHRRSLAIRLQHMDEAHESVIRNMNNLAMSLYRQKEYERAEELYRRGIALNRGADVPDLTSTLANNLGLLLRDNGRYREATAAFMESLRAHRELLGERHPTVANRLNNLGALYSQTGGYTEAEKMHREALDIHLESLGAESLDTATTKSLLAASLIPQERYDDAERLLREAYRAMRAELPDSHPRTQATIRRLVLLYESQQDTGRASEYEALLNP